jgi:ribonuclease HI
VKYVIYCDGGCDPNPGGAAGYGFVVFAGMRRVHAEGGPVGRGEGMTNNVAEYTALIRALEYLRPRMGAEDSLEVRADSELLVRQLNRAYSVKSANLARLFSRVNDLLVQSEWKALHIPREDNFEADRLATRGVEEARRLPLAGKQSRLGGGR